ILPDVIRHTAIGAVLRVERINRAHGPAGVLEEISRLQSDHARRVYFEELFRSVPLDSSLLRRAARQIASNIRSDGAKARLLAQIADEYLSDDAAQPAFFDAVRSIRSDGEHRRVLIAVLEKRRLSKEALLETLKSARRISSDGEKRAVLRKAAEGRPSDDAVLSSLLEVAATVSSDGEKRRVLAAVLEHEALARETLIQAMKATERMASAGEKRQVLVKAVAAAPADDAALAALLRAAGTISS